VKNNKLKYTFMNKIFLIIIIPVSLISCVQTPKFDGGWHWSDSTTTNVISLALRKDGSVSRYSGPNKTMHPEDLKNGKYTLKKDSVLVIEWNDQTIEKCQISLLSKNGLILTYGPDQGVFSNRKFVFGRVIDEEVRKDEIPPEIKN
jgi:hypothetical protein